MNRFFNRFISVLAVLGALAFPLPAQAQTPLSTTACPGTGCVTVLTAGSGTVSFQVVGTFVGTLHFYYTNNDADFKNLTVTDDTGSTMTSTTAPGFFTAQLSAYRRVKVAFTAYTSGTATVYASTSLAKAGTSSGGGDATIPDALIADSLCLDKANQDVCLARGDTQQLLVQNFDGGAAEVHVVGYGDGVNGSTSGGIKIVPATGDGGVNKIIGDRFDETNVSSLRVEGGTFVELFVGSGRLLVANGNFATNIRGGTCYGFSALSNGVENDLVTAGLEYGVDGVINATDCNATSEGALPATVQSNLFASYVQEPVASATEIAPLGSVTHVTGTAEITTIDPPAQCPATCEVVLIPDGRFTLATGGNIAQASSVVVGRPLRLVYDGEMWYSYDTQEVPVGGAEIRSISTNELAAKFLDNSGYTPFTAGGLRTHGFLALDSTSFAQSSSPSISSGFGTSPAFGSDNGTIAFTLTVGTGGSATSGVLAMPDAATGWNCFATDRTSSIVTRETATTTNTVTLTAASAWGAADVLQVSCFGY